MQDEWFEQWFDSPYYHILYRDHNDAEARAFIDALFGIIHPEADARILDLACGRGRHAQYMSGFGYEVTGLDISGSNIRYARRMESANLAFYQHDMRRPFRVNYFDLVFNFFTSFGYFRTEAEHCRTLDMVYLGMRGGGLFVLDYLNRVRVERQLVAEDERFMEGLVFRIRRRIADDRIMKTIDVSDGQTTRHFQENVRAFSAEELKEMFRASGLVVEAEYGNYRLEHFDPDTSERLILFGRKPAGHAH